MKNSHRDPVVSANLATWLIVLLWGALVWVVVLAVSSCAGDSIQTSDGASEAPAKCTTITPSSSATAPAGAEAGANYQGPGYPVDPGNDPNGWGMPLGCTKPPCPGVSAR